MAELPELIRSERLALVELLETLSLEEWSTPSLCAGWSVREVAAHLAWAPAGPVRELMAELVRQRFRFNRVNEVLASRWAAQRDTAEVLAQLRSNAQTGARPTGMPLASALADAVVHALDIRRPLNRPRPIAAEVFRPTAEFFLGMSGPLTSLVGGSARHRVAGVRLVNSDGEWTYGQGPEVRASADALLLLLSGRAVEPGELTGPGAETLSERIRPH